MVAATRYNVPMKSAARYEGFSVRYIFLFIMGIGPTTKGYVGDLFPRFRWALPVTFCRQ